MEPFTYISSLGLSGSLSTRPATALLVLSGAISFNWVAGPVWLTGFVPITIFVLLTVVEWNAGKDIMFIEIAEAFMPFIQAVLSAVIGIAMLNSGSAEALTVMMGEAEVAMPWWRIGVNLIWGAILAVLTFYAALYRFSFARFFGDFDEDNDLGLLSLHSWMEVFFTASCTLLTLFVPALAVILFILTAVSLRWVRKYLEKQEDKKMLPCPDGCGTKIYGSALHCPGCQAKNPQPMRVGLLGQTTANYATSREIQRWELLAQKRCPRCATKFNGRSMNQVCDGCQESVLDSPQAVKEYVEFFDQKLATTLIICAVAGLVPFVGLVFGVVYYRLNLVSPMRRYVPMVQGCMGRWGTRLINLLLSTFQPIPFVGAVMLPLMAFINFKIYRSMVVQSQYRAMSLKPA